MRSSTETTAPREEGRAIRRDDFTQQQAADLVAQLRAHGRRKSANQAAAKIPFELLNRVIKHLEDKST